MEKTIIPSSSSSLIDCMFMCYKSAATGDPLACLLFISSCVILTWVITFRDFYSSFRSLLRVFLTFFFDAFKCCGGGGGTNNNSNNATAHGGVGINDETTLSETCTINGDHCLSREDLEVVMGRLGFFWDSNNDDIIQEKWTSKEISDMFDDDDEKKTLTLEEVKGAFDVFDEDGDGFIDAKELKKVVGSLGFMEASEEECQEMINTFDCDGDGMICFGEFGKLLLDSFSS